MSGISGYKAITPASELPQGVAKINGKIERVGLDHVRYEWNPMREEEEAVYFVALTDTCGAYMILEADWVEKPSYGI